MSTTKLRTTPAQAAEAAAELDRTDRAILRALQRDASVSNVALAAKVNLSAPACLRRVERLKAAGLIKGMKPETLISDAPVTWRGWSPQNYGRSYAGTVTLQMALAKSYNTVPVRLAKDVLGTQVIVDTAKAMGVATPLRSDKTIPLGTSEVKVLDQATAYAVFPADGMQSRRHGIEQVLGRFWCTEIARHDRRRLSFAVWSVLSHKLLEDDVRQAQGVSS